MPRLSSVSLTKTTQSLGCSLFLVCFGGLFVAAGLYSLIFFGGQVPTSLLFGFLIFIGFGLMIALGGISQTRLALKFREPEVWIAEDVVRPGDTFHFFFKQQCRQPTTVESIGAFLVFRERASYDHAGDNTTDDIDRLIQQYPTNGRTFYPGDTIELEHTFQIPSKFMGLRNPYMKERNLKVQKMWVVKVRLNLGNSNDIWHEYEVKVQGEPLSSNLSPPLPDRYDVFLVESSFKEFFKHPLRTTSVMQKLLPHLRADQLPALSSALLLESVSEAEAQAARDQLAEVGAQVEIKPAS